MVEIDKDGLRAAIAVSCTGVVEAKTGKQPGDQHTEGIMKIAELVANHPKGLETLRELQQ